MSWAIGYDHRWDRDIGYGVPCVCDHPDCETEINRGLSYVCGAAPYGGEKGCGLFFCDKHLFHKEKLTLDLCDKCIENAEPFTPKDDTNEWKMWKIMDESWEK